MADCMMNYPFTFFLVFHYFRLLNSANLKRMLPEQHIMNEQLHHNQSRMYWLTNLEKGCGYELRVSYPATIPTEFLIKLTKSPDSLPTNYGRKLLNIEKIMFKNNQHEQYARVTAIRTGLPLDSERLKYPVTYNIVLEKLYLDLPWEVWKIATLVLCAVIIIFTFILPQVQRLFDKENLKFTKTM